jgi:hypothetical protein
LNQIWKHKTALFAIALISVSWGFSAHKELHALAISGLPPPIFSFFKTHQFTLIEKSIAADRRKHIVEDEAEKHYIDLDVEDSTVIDIGILPQTIVKVYRNLVYKMSMCGVGGDSASTINDVVRIAADLGHYIGDAHVPLHTTYNYNGQFSDQTGIHALWETHVYEITRPSWKPRPIKATYIGNIESWTLSVISTSHSFVDEVLSKEVAVRLRPGAPSQWGYRTRGRTMDIIPTPGFCREYADSLDNMVEKRFYESATGISCAWYSAWVDAGCPDLNKLKQRQSESKNIFQGLLQDLRELYEDAPYLHRQKQDTLQP